MIKNELGMKPINGGNADEFENDQTKLFDVRRIPLEKHYFA
jgi:hypothetical protein